MGDYDEGELEAGGRDVGNKQRGSKGAREEVKE
jgi:hypothetical protein